LRRAQRLELTRFGGHLPNDGSRERMSPWKSARSGILMRSSRRAQ